MRLLLKMTKEDWTYLETKFPNNKELSNVIVAEIERLKKKNPEPTKKELIIKDINIPSEYDEFLIKLADSEGVTPTHFIKKEIIYPSL